MNRVLTIAGSDSGGGAGIQADLKTITVLGAYGLSVITALTAQNTLRVEAIHEVRPDFVGTQLDAVLSDIGADAAKTGMLANTEVVQIVAAKLKQYQVPNLVVDPVMVAKSGDSLLTADAEGALVRDLLPLAAVLTPNLPEAGIILEQEVRTLEDMAAAARALKAMGPEAVLIKGGHLSGPATDLLFDGQKMREYSVPRLDSPNTHGTGCTFSAALATFLGEGQALHEAVARAKEYITEAIRLARPVGHGHGPTNHFAPLEKQAVLRSLEEAFKTLSQAEAGPLVPEVQANMGFALPGARDTADVAAFPGRIVRLGSRVATVSGPCFGASRHVARIILTTMRTDPEIRSALNIRYDEGFLERAREQGFRVESFDRADEPPETKAQEGSTLAWGVDDTIERTGVVPDLIFDRGEVGKEPMIRILGPNPSTVVARALSLLPQENKVAG
ncbi:MAG: bifunctional hydroxymethylpyrimidine kinase/phosphomethylpyrimidine kinase [Deltaproteobacteria bacterium]|nr:bifunctional hydroxymethylpyrimidine kinase/phosphomethylpyrimidine kinase [Deltaproteobacteria bacterium]